MRLASAEDWALPAGRLHLLEVVPDTAARPTGVPLSLNQRNHLAALSGGGASVWLAGAGHLPHRLDAADLQRAAAGLARRHSALQMSGTGDPGASHGWRHPPESWTYGVTSRDTTGGEQARRLLRAHLDRVCRPRPDAPAFTLAAVTHPGGTTLVIAADHFHLDAVSLPLLLDDAVALLAHPTPPPGPATVDLPEAGCFVTRAAEWAAAPRIAADDPRLERWYDLMDLTGDRLPTFPLDLGVGAGETAPHRSAFARIADPGATEALTEAGRAFGASTAALCLTTFANAVRRLGGPDELPVLVPVQTRAAGDERAVGWFTTTVPVLLHADGGPFDPAAVAAALARGTTAADLPLDQVLASLRRPLARARNDVFMLSYLDYRRVPGHETARALGAVQVSAPTDCDDVQVWVARTAEGLQARVRHPDTAAARRTVADLLDAWTAELRRSTSLAPAGC
ncbi:hypothetical protein JK386_13610 [Nocardioides sp. zg-536]|uniref:Peptide synthase n=1 Tax=Nocardioides faecalis TaxID=2803858 RepID=A0A938Y300_9ACTN|nr:hypothetical protein [Nocardioides faecalis]MBM9460936.1 hypothetical protein [Nocardioides faecalis]QVI59239.1 hypothetical protein KG111_02355 [Nocardioides faecalis]